MKKFVVAIILLALFAFGVCAQELEVKIVPEIVGQGKTLVVQLESPVKLKDLEVEFLKKEIIFYKIAKKKYRAILGIPLTTAPGKYALHFRIRTKKGLVVEWQETVRIKDVLYKRETLSIPAPKSKHLTSRDLGSEGVKLRAFYGKKASKQLWESKFILPAGGRISSPFGARRLYNNGIASWRHTGVDIANKEGTVIVAPNSGKVILSEDMRIHGETIIISHGQGIFSTFCHLKERVVTKGDKVKRGELIGTVGQTGLATGSHLHWGLCASGVAVDPLEWIERSFGD
jgi:murein DD-endopeptidase MepM/ murein hydrolase activator NlpD